MMTEDDRAKLAAHIDAATSVASQRLIQRASLPPEGNKQTCGSWPYAQLWIEACEFSLIGLVDDLAASQGDFPNFEYEVAVRDAVLDAFYQCKLAPCDGLTFEEGEMRARAFDDLQRKLVARIDAAWAAKPADMLPSLHAIQDVEIAPRKTSATKREMSECLAALGANRSQSAAEAWFETNCPNRSRSSIRARFSELNRNMRRGRPSRQP